MCDAHMNRRKKIWIFWEDEFFNSSIKKQNICKVFLYQSKCSFSYQFKMILQFVTFTDILQSSETGVCKSSKLSFMFLV